MARQRSHSIEFKRQVAQEFIAGESLYALSNKLARMAWAMMAKRSVTGNPSRLRRKRDRAGHPA
jgi:hypothetical protein